MLVAVSGVVVSGSGSKWYENRNGSGWLFELIFVIVEEA